MRIGSAILIDKCALNFDEKSCTVKIFPMVDLETQVWDSDSKVILTGIVSWVFSTNASDKVSTVFGAIVIMKC